ncbi:MAG TPA: NADH-quinone oxidoreductase subunit NuoG [Acidimicrobiales bacterium]|nr:NADH-quinone oxidoreductase subunit NuoG [Acidimicrobiales bacterium]
MPDPTVVSHHGTLPHTEPGSTVTFTLDGEEVTAAAGQFLIAAAEDAGVYIPRFCYHPRMKPVGMCRMCLVEVSGPRGATLQPACYVPVADGMEVVTTSEKVRKAQDGVLEFLLVNHPLDCPVCDKGGECPLQDQTLAYGPGESRFVEEKRHWAKPIALSDLVLLDRERCIQCGRCVRFATEIAGEAQIDFLMRGDALEVNVFDQHPFASYFSGNTVQICPVGALTAAPYRFTARPWDLDQVESTCTTCAFGCRVAVQSSANRVTRLLGIDADPVNQSWLCDKGRFAYEAVNSEGRLGAPLLRRRRGEELEPASWSKALSEVSGRLGRLRAERGPGSVGVIGGARLSNEDAYAWVKLAKGVIGTDNVDAQLGDGLPAELVLGLRRATIDEACVAPCVVTLCGDLREELPVLYLRLRGALDAGAIRLVELSLRPSALASQASASLPYRPGELGALVEAVVGGAEQPPDGVGAGAWAAARQALSAAGADGDGVVVVLGRPSVAEHAGLVGGAAVALARSWSKARFLPALRRGNVLGAIDMGLAPGVLPGRVSLQDGRGWFEAVWGSVPAERGRDTTAMLQALVAGDMAAVVLLGADVLGDFPDRRLVEDALSAAELVVAVDTFLSASSAHADVVLPAAMAHERTGSTTNIEGRITRLSQKLVPPGQCWPDWMIAAELAARLGGDLEAAGVGDLWDEIERLAPSHAGITRAVLDGPAGRSGVVAPLAATPVQLGSRPLALLDPMATPGIEAVEQQGAPPRAGATEPAGADELPTADGEAATPASSNGRPPVISTPSATDAPHVPARDAYAVRLVSGRRLYDRGAAVEASPSLRALAGTAVASLHPQELQRLGLRAGDRVRLRSARANVVLEVAADPGMAPGVVSVPVNLDADDGPGASALIDAAEAVTDVRLETL